MKTIAAMMFLAALLAAGPSEAPGSWRRTADLQFDGPLVVKVAAG